MTDFVFFDLEATGTDPHTDRIVEVCILRSECLEGADPEVLHTLVNPGCPIPMDATEVHGITNEDVRDAPTFPSIADRVQELLQDATLIGYASRSYDTVLVDAELRRAGSPGLPRGEDGRLRIQEIDLYQIWRELEPQTLVKAAARFAGVDLEDAHSASADTEVLPAVLQGIVSEFGLPYDPRELVDLSIPEGEIDRDGKFRLNEEGVPVFAFGKHDGQPVHSQPGYLEWMLKKDFSPETKAAARRFLEESRSPAGAF